MEIERSLHQIWFFLFVFVVLCLLLFWDKSVFCAPICRYRKWERGILMDDAYSEEGNGLCW
jgi:hypothetical protein